MKLAAISRIARTCMAISMCTLALGGCATYSSSFSVIQNDLAARQYDAALQVIDKQSNNKKDQVLYLLNKGMVLRMKGDYAASNQALEAGKDEMERLYAASVSENTLSFIVNDATVSYSGDDYEQVLVHLYMALNYLQLGQLDDARVEALQVDVKLREIGEKIPNSKLIEDAFSLYLTGLIYEDRGEWSDAMISYRQAYTAYKKYQQDYAVPMPTLLKYDLLRLAKREGLKDEFSKFSKEFDIDTDQLDANIADSVSGKKGQGELVFVLSNGLAPIKREKVISTLDPTSGTLVNIALPYYESRMNNVVAARMTVADKQANAVLVENIDAIARSSLEARMPAITARSIVRAVVKVAANRSVQSAAQKSNNNDAAMAGLIGAMVVQVATLATERADTRSWLTLPANIYLARLSLPPGTYDIKVDLLGINDHVVDTREYTGVEINKAKMTFLTQHWIPAQIHTK